MPRSYKKIRRVLNKASPVQTIRNLTSNIKMRQHSSPLKYISAVAHATLRVQFRNRATHLALSFICQETCAHYRTRTASAVSVPLSLPTKPARTVWRKLASWDGGKTSPSRQNRRQILDGLSASEMSTETLSKANTTASGDKDRLQSGPLFSFPQYF